MRELLNIVSEANAPETTVYHGGRYTNGLITTPFFVTTSYRAAASYADYNGGHVVAFTLNASRPARESDVERAALRVGVSEDDLFGAAMSDYVSPTVKSEATAIISELRGQGFDCARVSDFAMDGFTECTAYAIFDGSVLSQPHMVDEPPVQDEDDEDGW